MPESSGSEAYSGWLSLREIDRALSLDKGAAFRAFKRLLPQLNEVKDFIVLDHAHHAALVAQLHAQGRLYRSSVNPVLLAPAAAEMVRAALLHPPA